jgi:chromosome segregation protein
VFLKTLTLKGFKSFADTTALELEPGVTVVVGPNGSGKSNVVDAIAWVLGAQAPSAVRSQKMDDVIFAGTAKRPALGRAEVGLTIDNSNAVLPIEFTEVTVSRTLFRTGESEYAINGVPCRLLDVQELLSDAGVGRQQHVIVSQGQIDAVLNARPEDRRSIIEEAAGVLKFRKRKEKAERRLDATEASLLRVQDLLREVRRQLRPLERQAEAARRHGDLVAELHTMRVFLAGREIASLRARLTALAGDEQQAVAVERELRAELARLDTEVMAVESQLAARGDTDIGDELLRVEQLRERARGISAVIAERRRAMERDRGQLMDAGVVATLEAEAARLREELAAVSAELATIGPIAEQLAEDEEAFARERDGALPEIDEVAPAETAASAAAEVRGELRSVLIGLEQAEGEERRLSARLGHQRERLQRLEAEQARLRGECEHAEKVEAPLVAEVEAAESRRAGAESSVDAAVAARAGAAAELAQWQARSEALQLALDHAHDRAGAQQLSGLEGVLGTLLDLVEIDEGWEPAVEAALGEAVLAVVVADPAAARRALEHLRSVDGNGAVLSLGVQPAAAVPTIRDGLPVRGHVQARRGLDGSHGVDAVLDGLLGSAVRIDDWSQALDRALDHPGSIVVTGRGDRFGASGWRVGAGGGGATAAALEEAAERVRTATEALARREAEVQRAGAELAAARQSESDVLRRLDLNDAAFTAAADGLARVQGERREAAAEIETLERAAAELAERVERERRRRAELESQLPALEADEAAEAAAARARGEARARIDARAAELAGRRKDLEVRSAGLAERQTFLERRLAETERRLEADVVARVEAAERRIRLERALEALTRLSDLVDRHRSVVETRFAELQEQRRRQSDVVRALVAHLDELRRDRTAAERSLDETRERSRRIEIEEAEARMRLEAAVETLRRDLDAEPEVAEAAEVPVVPEGSNPAQRVRELERELRLLGPINPLALEEFTELQERHRFLEVQLEDVRTTRRELLRVIKAVDQEIQSTFAAAFADVADNFSTLFATLFPGGTGRLVLTNPDDLLSTGIEVEAKPSGKNVKKLSLLSGGERSLTALAYLFAVFRSRPSPFYVMDEVEAALDDVNLHRFLGLIDEFRREAQLLIVSHQKRTMEAADCLLGVSMQPGGSSKVVTERGHAAARGTA